MQRYTYLPILIFTVLTLAGCQPSSTAKLSEQVLPTLETNATKYPEVANKMMASYPIAQSIRDLVEHSTLIVLGQVEKVDRVVNTARNPNDISKPELTLLNLAQVYQVKIETVLKGEPLASTILIVQPEGFLLKPQASEEPSPEDVELARKTSDHISFLPGHRYLLFLGPLNRFGQYDYFVGAYLHPWRFDATDENYVYPESPAHLLNIVPDTLASIIQQIQSVPTPEPTVISPLPTPLPIETVVPAEQSAP